MLPLLVTGIWYSRQIRQQELDRALIFAIKKQDTPVAIALLDQGADANASDKPYAARTFKVILADLWEKINRKRPGRNRQNYLPALLIPYGNVFTRSLGRNTPKDNSALVHALLEHGADPNATDENGLMILHLATYWNHVSTVKVLLDQHIDPNLRIRFTVPPRERELTNDDSFYLHREVPPLCLARYDCARLLIKRGANVNSHDENGRTLLMRAYEPMLARLLIDHERGCQCGR